MTPLHGHCLDLDLHRLDLRFAASRLVEPHAVARLAESIERCGQIVPCIVVAAPGDEGGGAAALVLIDGYRRVAALRRLGRDTAGVEQWFCDLTQALRNDLGGRIYEQETPDYWTAKDATVQTPFYGFDHVTLVRAHGDAPDGDRASHPPDGGPCGYHGH